MAKMGEGEYYYYIQHSYEDFGESKRRSGKVFYICKRDAPHPNYTVIVEYASQDNASLIVDALNFSQDNIERFKLWKFDTQDGTKKPTY